MTDTTEAAPTTPRRRRSRAISVDAEAKAIGTVHAALKELPPDAQKRVQDYVRQRLEVK